MLKKNVYLNLWLCSISSEFTQFVHITVYCFPAKKGFNGIGVSGSKSIKICQTKQLDPAIAVLGMLNQNIHFIYTNKYVKISGEKRLKPPIHQKTKNFFIQLYLFTSNFNA